MTIATAAASLTAGTAKTILTAALLAHPAPAVAEWPQANDLGPVLENTKSSVNRQPEKAVSFRLMVLPAGGMTLPARMGARLLSCFQHPAHPPASEFVAGGFLLRSGAIE